jgi:Lon protease-like protein
MGHAFLSSLGMAGGRNYVCRLERSVRNILPVKIPEIQLPEKLPGMILGGCNLIPHNGLPVYIFEQRYRKMLNKVLDTHRLFFVAEAVGESDDGIALESSGEYASPIASVGVVRACLRNDDGSSHLFLQGLRRVRILEFDRRAGYPLARITSMRTQPGNGQDNRAARREIEAQVENADGLPGQVLKKLFEGLQATDDVEVWADMAGARLLSAGSEQRTFLEMESLTDRIRFLGRSVDRLRNSL